MGEKTYSVMKQTGGLSIALGVIMIVFGIAVGVLTIVNGGRLLKKKSDIMF